MEPKTFFILLAIGVTGYLWSQLRNNPKVIAFGHDILEALDIVKESDELDLLDKEFDELEQALEDELELLTVHLEALNDSGEEKKDV